ncbi:putative ABC transporter [Meredithblackwellia eburnea MCA 4105]
MAAIKPEDAAQVTQLARQLSRQVSQASGSTRIGNPFLDSGEKLDSVLDPLSPNFSVSEWVKHVSALTSRDPERYLRRTAGVSFSNLNVFGFGKASDYQKTVGNAFVDAVWDSITALGRAMGVGKPLNKIRILREFEGLVKSGEMLIVLGRPGSGCSTLLKTIAGETHGFFIEEGSNLQYQGIPAETVHSDFRGEVIYQAEQDVHFPMLTVGQTLEFAALARTPQNRLPGVTREQYAEHMAKVIMATFGLSHTVNTPVGNEYIRGVSGGERKRVSIAEAMLSRSPLQCWDNTTRGLDSANALEFVRNVRLGTDTAGSAALIAIYQCPQDAYDIFDKVIVLYKGYQIYYGPANSAREFFTSRGYHCPPRQTTADFLTSLTNPTERIVEPGWEKRVPRTPEEFAKVWKESPERRNLIEEINAYEQEFPLGGDNLKSFRASRAASQAKHMKISSPFTISVPMQVKLCMKRGFQRLRNDATITATTIFGYIILALIISSVFYNLKNNTNSFFSRGACLFFAILMNAFSSSLEILTLYAQRPIVEKHNRYALYHPFTEAISSMLCDMPSKILVSITFNLTLYFMTNLRREVGAFFFFLFTSFLATLVMSSIFRIIASVSRTLHQALAPAAILILGLVCYTGFALPITSMHGWSRWINWIDPISYAFESLMVNEYHNRRFPCSAYLPSGPGYENISSAHRICTVVGSVAGFDTVLGDDYLAQSFGYYNSHKWRNIGILIAFWIVFTGIYWLATEKISAQRSKGEVLIFRQGHVPSPFNDDHEDEETGQTKIQTIESAVADRNEKINIHRQTATFHWEDVCYDIKIKGEGRRILDHVDGWVRPGTLTALMGASGAGKTTLLDVLASRVTMGVITGSIFVDGQQRDKSFQRKTGYCMQQDLHLSTATVRESLTFSALCRQPNSTPKAEKIAYVEEVIKILEMEEYADAVVGVPGEGLNVEQRKRLTIGVELAAKPDLLLFLDEPSSGLDSQTAWSMVRLCRRLANNGQAILCTIHQPSAILIAEFDRLLLLHRGCTAYFGEIGESCSTMIKYFESNGADPCPPQANPAEWMLRVIGAAPGSHTDIDWRTTWRGSPEYKVVHERLNEMRALSAGNEKSSIAENLQPMSGTDEFAMPLSHQLWYCLARVWAQYWRTPSYIYSKVALTFSTALFVGFSFYRAPNTAQGLQNKMFSIFMLLTSFGSLVQQIMPLFVSQRALYEARERPSKTYAWQAFMGAQILVEIPWQVLVAVITFFCWYYPVGFFRNASYAAETSERGGLMFLFVLAFYVFTSTFAAVCIAPADLAESGGNTANFLYSICLIFCGVLATPSALPRFWIFMYRVSPFTYLVSGMLTTGISGAPLVCSATEVSNFAPPAGRTCEAFMAQYIRNYGGELYGDKLSTTMCEFCGSTFTDSYLALLGMSFKDAWRNFGLLWVYIIFNIAAAVFLYWIARVPKKRGEKAFKREKKE